jgi:hypothetical protein
MKRIAVGFGFLVAAIITLTSMSGYAQDCPSGHYYRMSGRCADASGHKVYGTPKTVKRTTYKKPQGY